MNIAGNKFLVTGGAGFIGSHLVDMLLQEDAKKVVVFDNFIRGSAHNLEKAIQDDRVELFEEKADLTNVDQVNKATLDVDGVFHLASMCLSHCQKYPRSAVNVNIMGTFNLLDACVKNNVERIVFASSSSIYGNADYSPMDEKHPFNYRDFYAATKLTGEALLRTFNFEYGLEYAALRFMNIYGPRQDYLGAYVAIIMKIIDRIQQNLAPIIYGDGSQSFDFVFVSDACLSLFLAMTSSIKCNSYNISSGKQISILNLCKKIQKRMNSNHIIEFINKEEEKHLITNRIGSTEKAKDELRFEVEVSLENGLKQVIDWKLTQSPN